MSMETYEAMLRVAEVDDMIAEAEADYNNNGLLYDARDAMASLRRKHFE